ncbi:uncharacterized protein CC84DRAFT_1182126 [Paraphaeosphaeria sporulosa]|uniref:Uncharacterized protein n=1 Tax=Paraphaeosphaeria sporulosa TaxID=1460663 RepID=A0A177BUW8_9PLEO|nr:uncharacterized protein CC84DRAFT_1182126 [Paraphaeosphaeria sporulosa]OAF98521.1 hypothetical protein CC84DRAFT_1182126 [Paraphaeosphaeria sporulosa]
MELAEHVTFPGFNIPQNAFSKPILIISRHNLKLSELSGHLTFHSYHTALEKFIDSYWDRGFLDPSRFYWDLGIQTGSNLPGTTTLRKSYYLRQWTSFFNHSNTASRSKPRFYTFTRTDVGSAELKLRYSNQFYYARIRHVKAYNTIKEITYAPIRGYGLFTNPQLELLGATQQFLNKLKFSDTGRTEQTIVYIK